MIIKEELSLNNNIFIRHYSDCGRELKQLETGIIYSEAIDIKPCKYTYEEVEEPINDGENVYTEEGLDEE